MRVFVVGATGVLGRRVVRRLVQGGHRVVGLSRQTRNAEVLRAAGAEPRDGDLFDRPSVLAASEGCEAFLHLATAIPPKRRTTAADWAENDRVRREGTANVVAAALAAGSGPGRGPARYVQQSVAFVYGDRRGAWVDETIPVPEKQVSIVASAVAMERLVLRAAEKHGLLATVLRFGSFYAADSAQTQMTLRMAARGWFPVFGDGSSYMNPIHVDDAAAAVCAALESPTQEAPGTVYNVTDDAPVTMRELGDGLAQLLGARRPAPVPVVLAKLAAGAPAVETLLQSFRCKTDKIKQELGWKPVYPSFREGYAQVIGEWRVSARSPSVAPARSCARGRGRRALAR